MDTNLSTYVVPLTPTFGSLNEKHTLPSLFLWALLGEFRHVETLVCRPMQPFIRCRVLHKVRGWKGYWVEIRPGEASLHVDILLAPSYLDALASNTYKLGSCLKRLSCTWYLTPRFQRLDQPFPISAFSQSNKFRSLSCRPPNQAGSPNQQKAPKLVDYLG